MAHVGRVADFALLAVVDDVYAGLELLADDVADGAAHAHVERLGVRHPPRVKRLQSGRQVLGPRKAAGVCRQNAVGAKLHRRGPSSALSRVRPKIRGYLSLCQRAMFQQSSGNACSGLACPASQAVFRTTGS
jgi:hypothetical protein